MGYEKLIVLMIYNKVGWIVYILMYLCIGCDCFNKGNIVFMVLLYKLIIMKNYLNY